jgi:ferredoxin
MNVKVWIDQDICTGDGLCEEICPEIFGGHTDGLFYVKEPEWPSIVEDETGPKDYPIYQMAEGVAHVPDRLVNAVIEAAEECPGECIFIEVIE